MRKCNILHLLSKLCKITPNFNLVLSNEIAAGANRKFFTLSLNGFKAIAANQSNPGGKPFDCSNSYKCREQL